MEIEFYFPTDMVIIPPRHKNLKEMVFWDKSVFKILSNHNKTEIDRENSISVSLNDFSTLLSFIADGKKRNEKEFKNLRSKPEILSFDIIICNYLDQYLSLDRIDSFSLNHSQIQSDNIEQAKSNFQNFLNIFMIDENNITIPVYKKDFLNKKEFCDKEMQTINILLDFYLKLYEKGSWLIQTNKACLKHAGEIIELFENNIDLVKKIIDLKNVRGTQLDTSEKEMIKNFYVQHICKNTNFQKAQYLLSEINIWKPFFTKKMYNGEMIFENYTNSINNIQKEEIENKF